MATVRPTCAAQRSPSSVFRAPEPYTLHTTPSTARSISLSLSLSHTHCLSLSEAVSRSLAGSRRQTTPRVRSSSVTVLYVPYSFLDCLTHATAGGLDTSSAGLSLRFVATNHPACSKQHAVILDCLVRSSLTVLHAAIRDCLVSAILDCLMVAVAGSSRQTTPRVRSSTQ